MITRLTALPGRRDELALMLMDPAVSRRGCHSYVVAHGTDDPDALWVTEIWINEEAHRACVEDLKATKALRPALALVATIHDSVVTRPITGIGL